MKYPKKMEIKLITGDTFIIDLLNVKYDPQCNWFTGEVRISPEFVNSATKENVITFETEER